ncbi:MAG: YCF48-related protein [Steroidobacteraceae bacterium]
MIAVRATRQRRRSVLLACGVAWLALAAGPHLRARRRGRSPRPPGRGRATRGALLLLDVARAGPRLVAVGERGHVLLSDDDGRSWRQSLKVPSRTMLTAVAFADAQHGWAVGHDEVILATSDGGESWTRSHYAPETQQPLLDVWFADAQHGIAVGAYGSYFVTADGGASWESRKFASTPLVKPAKPPDPDDIPPDYHLNRIAPAGAHLFIAAESGQIYRSDDGGQNWKSLPSPYNGSFFGLLPLGGDSLLVFGLRGNLFRSDDAGANWRRIESGTTAMLTDAVALGGTRYALVGLSGTVLVSADGGASWKLEQQADRKGLSAALPLGSGALVAVGEDGARTVALQ